MQNEVAFYLLELQAKFNAKEMKFMQIVKKLYKEIEITFLIDIFYRKKLHLNRGGRNSDSLR